MSEEFTLTENEKKIVSKSYHPDFNFKEVILLEKNRIIKHFIQVYNRKHHLLELTNNRDIKLYEDRGYYDEDYECEYDDEYDMEAI